MCLGIVVVFSIYTQGVVAGELDTARQCYAAISDGLGHSTLAGLDTTTASYTYLRNALNAGLRAVQKDNPFPVRDTITLVDLTFHYTLNGNFVQPEDGKPSGYRVERYDATMGKLWGMKEATVGEFGTFVAAPSGLFRVEGDLLIVNSYSPVSDVLYVYGPGESTTVLGGGTLITYPLETIDRWAAVYYATWMIAVERSDQTKASYFAGEYQRITGTYPQVVQ